MGTGRMTELLLHIGMPKTGSTDIQAWCDQHREALAEQGVLFPRTVTGSHSHRDLLIPDDSVGTFDEAPWRALREQIRELRPQRVVLSEEDLFFLDSEGIDALRQQLGAWVAPERTHVVAYLRRQDLWLESRYKHAVRAKTVRFPDSIDEFIDQSPEARAVLDYATVLDRWQASLAPASITARPFEREQFDRAAPQGSLVADFLHETGVAPPAEPGSGSSTAVRNIALERNALEVMRTVNRLEPSPETRRRLLRAAREATAAARQRGGGWPWPLLSPSRRHEILERAAAGNAEVARRFLATAGQPLFRETPDATDGEWHPYPGLTPAAARAVLGYLPGARGSASTTGNEEQEIVARVLASTVDPAPVVSELPPPPPDSGGTEAVSTGHRPRAMLRGFRRAARALLGRKA